MRHLFRIAVPGVSALAAGLLCASNASAAPGANGFRVLHHEAVRVTSAKGVGSAERMSFTAYGRHFDLNVAPNQRIRRGVSSSASSALPLAGSVEGLAGSWVRVTRSASGLRGMLFDGQDLYAIEPAAEAAAVTVQPLSASDGDTVVYRLSDALMPVQTMSCEVAQADSTPETPATAADAFQQLSTELRTFQTSAVETAEPQTAEANATKQVRVGVVADYEFVTQFGNSTPEDAIVARMNIVDGIFSSQLGVKISLGTPTLFRSASDPFTQSKASELLAELANYRFGSQAQQQNGITHLMTGRDLETTTVGIAYLSRLCDAKNGVSLSQSGLNTTQAALVAAHEIGHNFGAPHDGENACASSPQTFLMAPQLNGSDKFSACSISQIQALMGTVSSACLKDYAAPDASINGPSTLNGVVGTAFVASFSVTAVGDDSSSNVNVSATVPTGLTVNSASVNGGSCQTGTAGSVTCALGTLASGDTRQVDLNLTATTAGALALTASVTSSNDANSSNNSGTINVSATTSSTPPPTPPATGGSSTTGDGGGGGGTMDGSLLSLLGLASLFAVSRRRARRFSR